MRIRIYFFKNNILFDLRFDLRLICDLTYHTYSKIDAAAEVLHQNIWVMAVAILTAEMIYTLSCVLCICSPHSNIEIILLINNSKFYISFIPCSETFNTYFLKISVIPIPNADCPDVFSLAFFTNQELTVLRHALGNLSTRSFMFMLTACFDSGLVQSWFSV